MLLGRAEKIIHITAEVFTGGAAVAIAAMAVLVTYSTVSRYFFNTGVPYMEELAGFLLIASGLLPLAYVFLTGGHIRVEIVTGRLRPRVRDYLEVVVAILMLLYVILFFKMALDFTIVSYRLDCHSLTAGLYEVPWMALMPLTLMLLFIVVLIVCIKRAKSIGREYEPTVTGWLG